MTTALVLGGADCLHRDIEAYSGPVDLVIACNDAGTVWPGRLDAWVSLHPVNFWDKQWLATREANGYPAADRMFAHLQADRASKHGKIPPGVEFTEYRFPGQAKSGSSGLFAAKVALINFGAAHVVFCGVPMVPVPHFFGGDAWDVATRMREEWRTVPAEYLARMRSMSGWTQEMLGAPDGNTG